MSSRNGYRLASTDDKSSEEEGFESYVEHKSRSQAKKRSLLYLYRVGPATAISFIVYLLFRLGSHDPTHSIKAYLPKNASFPFHYESHADYSLGPLNSTLNFGKIYVLNMPFRTDKRAEMTLLAHQYGLDIEFVYGITGKTFRPDLPEDFQGKWGVAEAHAKVWQTFVDSRYETALIFEDDVDFDIRIKEQLRRLHGPLATYLSVKEGIGKPLVIERNNTWLHKYWEILWLGNCLERPEPREDHKEGDPIPYVTYDDPTVTGPEGDRFYVHNTFNHYGLRQGNDSKLIRMIKKPYDVFCLQGYAISRSGAKKILYNHAHTRNHIDHIDGKVAYLQYDGRLTGLSILPPIFSQFRHASGDRDSDREQGGSQLPGADGVSLGIVQSAKQKLADDIGMTVKPKKPVEGKKELSA